jgi:3-oxoacyl-(acyl-carrier-protein) synthase
MTAPDHPHNPARIVIAGVGLVSPLAVGAWPTFSALLVGHTIAERCGRLPGDMAAVDLVRAVGSVNSAPQATDDPAVELAECAAREAGADAGVQLDNLPAHIGTSKGAVHRLTQAAAQPRDFAEVVALGPCGYLSAALRRRLRLGATQHHVAACASSLTALHQARLSLLHRDDASETRPGLALVVTAESALLPMFIHSYRRLGVLAPARAAAYVGRPLDENRNGFMLTELAAAVLLKRSHDVQLGDIELLDTAVATEPHDLIRPAPRMHTLAHVARSLVHGRDIDVLHTHTPGTVDHDDAELAAHLDALQRAGRGRPCDVYANKGALGHGLGAAGLVSLVIANLCARTGRRPPMPWLEHPIALPGADRLSIAAEPDDNADARTHAVFAAGFGGHVAGAVIRRA